MKIYYLGTCSGTEPMAGMHQCSLIIEVGGAYYWFDAGEGCGYTAYVNGLDPMRAKCLFISHCHIDHIGGMPHLLFLFHKLIGRNKVKLNYENKLRVFIPELDILEAAKTVACGSLNHRFAYEIEENAVSEGVVFEDENVRISAVANDHRQGKGPSYSYLIEAEGKRVVFSGDVKSPAELDPFTREGCNLLIMETGHHKVIDVCEYARQAGIGTLRFNHHGREIIADRQCAEDTVRAFAKENDMDIKICYDMMIDDI